MAQLTRAEQETVIRWDAEVGTAYIDTANPVTIRKLDKLVAEFPEVYRCVREDKVYLAKRYELPVAQIRFAKPPSEATRMARANNFARNRMMAEAAREATMPNMS